MVNVRSRANIGNCELRRMLGTDSTAAEGRLKIQKRKMTEQLQVVESAGQNIDGKIVRQTTNDLSNNRHMANLLCLLKFDHSVFGSQWRW